MTTEHPGSSSPGARDGAPTRRRVLRIVVNILVLLISFAIIASLLSDIDFAQVRAAISGLSAVQVLVIVVLLLVLRTLNATPLTVFIRGLSIPRALLNDLSGNLISTVSPPPSDMVVRYTMFRAWSIDLSTAFVGVTINTLLFYVVRFSVPLIGVVIVALGHSLRSGMLITSVGVGALALLIIGTLAAVLRAERTARVVGRTAGRLARKFRPAAVDPDDWAARTVAFRARFRTQLLGWPVAVLAMLAMVLTDAVILLYCQRITGLSAEAVGPFLVVGAFLVAYPLTALPFAGIGVLDALLLELVTSYAGPQWTTPAVAGLIVWRTTTLLLPLLAGALSYGIWRLRARSTRPPADLSPKVELWAEQAADGD